MIGADTWDGTPAQLRNYRTLTGTRFPLLLRSRGMTLSYGPIESYVVVDRQGIVRYNSYPRPLGGLPPVDEIRAVIDSLAWNPTPVRPDTWGRLKALYRDRAKR